MLNAKLTVVGGDAKSGDEVKLRLPTVVGRGKEAGMTIPHALVSRQHCEIFERDGQLVVRDCGSLNGTFINSTRIENEQVLEPNQLLTLGNITFRAIYEVGVDIGSDISLDSKASQSVAVATGQVVADAAERPTVKKAEKPDQGKIQLTEPEPVNRSALSEIDSFEPDDSDSFAGLSQVQSKVIASQARSPVKPTPAADAEIPCSAAKVRDVLKTQTVEDFRAGEASVASAASESEVSAAASGIDLGIETGRTSAAAVSSIDGLPVDDNPQVSFIGKLGDQPATAQILDSINIDVAGEEKNRDIDEDRLGSFMKKLPK
jgi:predicted component of type VI protein secretion system